MFNVEPSKRRKRAYVPRTRDPVFKNLQPGQKIYPVDEKTARSFARTSQLKGWTVWRARISPGVYEIGREA